jgi:hypothetical protein
MIKHAVIAVASISIIIWFVSGTFGESIQPVPLQQEFDSESQANSSISPQTTAPPLQATVSKRDIAATVAKQGQDGTVGENGKASGQSTAGGLKDLFLSLLPSKQDVEKAFNAESSHLGTPRTTNWREQGR